MDDLLKEYNNSIVDIADTKKNIKKKLDKYEASLKEAKKPSYEEQEEGWTVVHHKRGRDPTKKHSKKKQKTKQEEKLINFYAFEVKESKLKKHRELLEKFEEDKRRLAKMREQRKFKL